MAKDRQGTARITIIGTGLIGGSLGLALKAAQLEGIEIVGHDRDRGAANRAERAGAIDKAEHNLPRAVEQAHIVIIATPVLAVREVMQQIAEYLQEGAVVTDTASTKADVLRWAEQLLPTHVSFVGGHPMAGKETPGVDEAEATLFQGKAYCICPGEGATDQAVRSVIGLAQAVGAEPLFMDAEEHDQYAAAVSHMPLLLSAALFNLLRSSPAWSDMAQMASSGFRDATRLASSDPRMSHDICVTNREAAVHWLGRMQSELERLKAMLEDARDEALLETLARVQIEREEFLRKPPRREREPSTDGTEVRREMIDALIGGWAAERMRRAQKLPELMKEAREAAPAGEGKRPQTLGEKIAEDIRRDLEKRSEQQKK